ncbi:MAG: 16S rRNA (adenine(1518)-N(6)/adenine(1519)-N(6))-dimethyltransferase [Bacteroidetes bacterium B1(2017)]|nr:MAG: 16S rRNA (adenine(1518)-N(6)/adenine(1519)-N(6))-dimethyltransferase [Bacteroidetes bacterium B1(2017)]
MTQAVRAKKHLGQHFLKDQNIAGAIVSALVEAYQTGAVLEVGPGMGVLTKYLLEQNSLTTWAAEVDSESITYLHASYPHLSERLLNQSFLEINLSEKFTTGIAVIGNFPYNISSQIIFHILDHRDAVPVMVGMFQKEVAERIGAKNGGKEYGIISVITQAFYDVEYLFTVHEHVFDPPPKVKSGVIRMVRRKDELGCEEALFRKVIKTAFNQRRKKLRNAISVFGLSDEKLGEFATKRAEELSVADFVALTNLIAARE